MTTRPNHLLAGILLIVAALVCFWRLSLHPADLLVGPQSDGNNDLTRYYLSARERQGEAMAGRDASLCWDPYVLAGTPSFGNPQGGILYPPNWLYALVPARFLISWVLVAHHWWAGFGTYLLSRRYGLSWSASVLAGMCFLGSPYLLAQSGEGHYAQICVVAWIPFAFLGVESLREGRRGGVVLTAAVLALCFFGGHVQELFYLVLLLTLYLTPDFAGLFHLRGGGTPSSPSARHAATRLMGSWALVGLAAAGLTAVELIPNWVYSRNSIRAGGLDVEAIRLGVLGFSSLLQLLDPFALGGPLDYRGPGRYYCETLCCLGIPALVFGLAGLGGAIRRRPMGRFAVLGLVGLIFAFGDQTPLFPLLHRWVPGVSLFRSPARMLFFCSFFAAILAGAGFDQMRSLSLDARRKWRSVLAVTGVFLACVAGSLLMWRWLAPPPAASAPTVAGLSSWAAVVNNLAWGSILSVTAAVLSAMWLLSLPIPRPRCAIALGCSAVCISAAWYAGHLLRTIPRESAGRANPAIEFLRDRLGADRVLAGQDLLSDRESRRNGINKLQGYDPVPLARLAMYAVALIPEHNPAEGLSGFEHLRLAALRKPLADALGVRYAVLPGRGPEQLAGWRRVSQGNLTQEFAVRGQKPALGPYTIYENADPMPRCFVVGHAQTLQPATDAVRQLAELDPRRAVLVDRDVLPPGPRQSFRPAEMVEYTASRVIVRATLDAPGYLVLSDAYYPGWTAHIAGQPAAVLPANLAFRAVALPAGRHAVEFRCRPPSFQAGAFLSALTILGLVIGARRRRSSQIAPPKPKEPAR